jgi:hypothetical protein
MMKDVSSFSVLFCCYYFLFSIALFIISERVMVELIQIPYQDAGFGHTSNLIALANRNTHQQFFPFQMIHTSYVCQFEKCGMTGLGIKCSAINNLEFSGEDLQMLESILTHSASLQS